MYTIAIVGRPNVGKSTLFNRLVGGSKAIVNDRPGVTRDRREGKASLADLSFNLIDTAGLEEAPAGSIPDRMRQQTEKAIAMADLVLLVFDAREGITSADSFFANLIRKSSKDVVVLGNKCEGKAGISGIADAYSLGLGDPVPFSAEHGQGIGDLYDAFVEIARRHGRLDELTADIDEEISEAEEAPLSAEEDTDTWIDASVDRPMKIAFIGRPNMGKSTLVNRLLGEERLLTGPEAGITRDAIEVPFEWQNRSLILTDTAGMRRRARIAEKLETQMVDDALRAIRFAHVCVLLIDATEPLGRQDLAIARLVAEEGRVMVVAANMWDVVHKKQEVLAELRYRLDESLGQVRGVPLLPISALKGSGVDKLMKTTFEMYERWNVRVSTSRLNRWLGDMLESHPPPLVDGRRLRIRYATQVKTRPPTFALFASKPLDLPDHYLRYLAAGMRRDFGMGGLPIRLLMRKNENPYTKKS